MKAQQTLNERLAQYRKMARETFRAMSDQALEYQNARVIGGIDREELDREMDERAARRFQP